jgi:cation:H+ antiporter
MVILLSVILIALSSVIIWRSTDGFELASDYLGRRMSRGIKGATINAVASSMPEFLSTVFFLFYLKDANGFSGGVGITGGSAVFNILVIPIAVFFVVRKTMGIKNIPVERKTFLRDGIILLIMTGFVAVIVNSRQLLWWHGALLTAPYLGYLLFLFISHKRMKIAVEKYTYAIPVVKTPLKRVLMIDLEWLVLRGRYINGSTAWLLLLASVFVMITGTWLLVFATDLLGKALDIPILFVSVILAAAASSIPDTMISIRDAKKGNYEDAFSNALGSNIFDISFALGFPLLIYTLFVGEVVMDQSIIESSSDIWVVLFLITAGTVFILQKGCCLNGKKTTMLIAMYLLFLAFIIIDYRHDIGLVNLFKSLISDINY